MNQTEKQKAAVIWMIDDALRELDQIKGEFEREVAGSPPSYLERKICWTMDRLNEAIDKLILIFKRR